MKRSSWIATYTGKKFYPFNPKSDDVCIIDIAQSLSLLCRFNGHSNEFYSVAQHSILCAQALMKTGYTARIALIALLHDAGEAYLSDIPSPIKKFIPELSTIEDNILRTIFNSFKIEYPSEAEWEIVKEIDTAILSAEGVHLTHNVENWTERYNSEKSLLFNKEDFEYRDRLEVRKEFIKHFADLQEGGRV